jgi:hypothetical protein
MFKGLCLRSRVGSSFDRASVGTWSRNKRSIKDTAICVLPDCMNGRSRPTGHLLAKGRVPGLAEMELRRAAKRLKAGHK